MTTSEALRSFGEFSESGNATEKKIAARPFVKWVGGKSQLLPELVGRIPRNFGRYFEPFLGGGALFFALQHTRSTIIDSNQDLINAYNVVQRDVDELISELSKHYYDQEYYYKLRNIDRMPEYSGWSGVEKAARLIYLNKTCFNGLYRVNSKGFFNTPFGRYSNPTILDAENLRACSVALKDAEIRVGTFEVVLDLVEKGDFVYFDPPYVPLTATSSFTKYNKEGFNLPMQESLRDVCKELDRKGVSFLLSNSTSDAVYELYKEFKIEVVKANRFVNSKSTLRGKIPELLVANY